MRLALAVLVLLLGCTQNDPALDLKTVTTLDPLGRTARVQVVATQPDGTIGAGHVTLTSSLGALDETDFTLDAFGTANTTLTCPTTDPACTAGASLTLTATWTRAKGDPVTTTAVVRIGQVPTVWSTDHCPPEAKLVYLFTSSGDLYSFHPPTKALKRLGPLACAAMAGATPNSMAVSQDGTGWVNYSDGSLFRVNVRTLACSATTFTPPTGWTHLGMGFSPDSATAVTETLFIATAAGLAKVDLSTMTATVIGPFTGAVSGADAELTSDPLGNLYGFFVPTGAPLELASIAKDTAVTSNAKTFPSLVLTGAFSFAFSSWSADFYLYTASGTDPTTVTKYDGTLGTTSTWMTAPAGVQILGAGVSRCGAAQ